MLAWPLRRAAAERVGLEAAAGRVLAQDIIAPEDVPPFARSRVDGYAVSAADVNGASRLAPSRLQLAGAVAMGQAPPSRLLSGQAMDIPTGGALPPGADGVVMIEDTAADGDSVRVFDGAGCTLNYTQAGADVRAGDALFERGAVLGAAALGLLAAAGVAAVDVYARPAVAVLLSGDELVAPGEALGRGQIRDVNRYALTAAIVSAGFAVELFPALPDDRAVLAAALDRGLRQCDAVVISGGSSVGERDYTPGVVAGAGLPGVLVHGVLAKPGRPTLLAVIGDQPVIGLPGNPVSALVMWEALGRPILLGMFAKRDETLPLRAVLDSAVDVDPRFEHRVAVRLRRGVDGLHAEPLLGTSAQMHILAFADAIVVIPLGTSEVSAGSSVDAFPIAGPLR
ncbi:MAG: molybdopterin molybdotransferase MoeA [Candidatus Eremiobacteraeota bacterium]|nr:molybdopterin molybdotransferase MoeA [Candidatus Eremiobacteraeota bacterium]